MTSSDKASWASVALAAVAIVVNAWYANESHKSTQASTIAKEALEAEQAKVSALQGKATIQEIALSNALNRVCLYGDILAAEGGDRRAYVSALKSIRLYNQPEDSEFLRRKLSETTTRFSADGENEYLRQCLAWPSPTAVENIKEMLKHEQPLQRFYAIQKAYELRRNLFIPDIMDIALTDRDLRVVQLAIYVINKTFEENMIFNVGPRCNLSLDECIEHPKEARDQFDKAWEVHKEKILGRKPKEYRYGKDKNPPHLQMMYLFDPERPDDIPVLKE